MEPSLCAVSHKISHSRFILFRIKKVINCLKINLGRRHGADALLCPIVNVAGGVTHHLVNIHSSVQRGVFWVDSSTVQVCGRQNPQRRTRKQKRSFGSGPKKKKSSDDVLSGPRRTALEKKKKVTAVLRQAEVNKSTPFCLIRDKHTGSSCCCFFLLEALQPPCCVTADVNCGCELEQAIVCRQTKRQTNSIHVISV